VKEVGRYKYSTFCSLRDPSREEQILRRINYLAAEKDLDVEFVSKLFQSLFTYYTGEQAKEHPAAEPAPLEGQ
ncbi:MAG TPA: chorismate mutase, partial [Bacillota bacterium]|nr:chorismate mutase [Bacillota bacterium]